MSWGCTQIDAPRLRVLLEPRQLVDKRGCTSGKYGLRGSRCPTQQTRLETQQVAHEPVILREPRVKR